MNDQAPPTAEHADNALEAALYATIVIAFARERIAGLENHPQYPRAAAAIEEAERLTAAAARAARNIPTAERPATELSAALRAADKSLLAVQKTTNRLIQAAYGNHHPPQRAAK